jgi:hypothetical protein
VFGGSAFAGAFAAVLCLASLHGCGRKGDLLAVVNGAPISMRDFIASLSVMPKVLVTTDNGKASLQVSGTLGGQNVVQVVREEILLQLAKEKGVFPTKEQVEHEVNLRKRQSPSFLLDLEAQGMSLEMIRKSLEASLAEENLITQGIQVTDDQTKAYIKQHLKEFETPAKVRLTYIFVRSESEEKAVDENLAAGQAFSDVALRQSQAPTAEAYNGDFTDPNNEPPTLTSLPEIVQSAIQDLPVYGTSIWVPYGGGFARFYVQKRFAAEPFKMEPDKVETVRRQIARSEGAQVNDVEAMVRRKISQSQIQIFPDQFKTALEDDADTP